MPSTPGATERSSAPGRRRVDHTRQVTWRDYRHLQILLWVTLAISVASSIGWGVTTFVLFHQVNQSRAYTASKLCAAVDAVRSGTVDGFQRFARVAGHAGLNQTGTHEILSAAHRLQHPPAAQDCRVIVRAVKDVQTGPLPQGRSTPQDP